MCLESFAEDGVISCPGIGLKFVPPLRCQKLQLHWALFALNDGGTSRPADVEERSALAGVCGLTSVWRWTAAVLLMSLKASTFVLNQMWAATGSQRRSQRRQVTWENLGRL